MVGRRERSTTNSHGATPATPKGTGAERCCCCPVCPVHREAPHGGYPQDVDPNKCTFITSFSSDREPPLSVEMSTSAKSRTSTGKKAKNLSLLEFKRLSTSAKAKAGTLIARELNRRGVSYYGKPWLRAHVNAILRNPKYMGCNTWARSNQRLRGPKKWVERQQWITKPLAFESIVDEATFERAQALRPKLKKWTKEIIVEKVREFLKENGRISADILAAARGLPTSATITRYFGSYEQLYKEVGYRPDTEDIFMGKQRDRSRMLRRKIVSRVKKLFPENVIVTHIPRRTRSVLLVDHSFMVSILLCIPKLHGGKPALKVESIVTESEFITLLCITNKRHDRVLKMLVLPKMTDFTRTCRHDSWIRKGIRLRRLSDFYAMVKKCWAERCKQEMIIEREQSKSKIANHLWDGEFVK